MDVLKPLLLGDPSLRQVADPVPTEWFGSSRLQETCDLLVRSMRAAHGSGLAATQIGIPLRICVMEVHSNPRYPYKPSVPLTVMVNPVIRILSDKTFPNYEGCLSVPGIRGIVHRATEIELTGWYADGTPFQEVHFVLRAGTVQHEIDHLDGLLFLDRVNDSRTLTTWENFASYHKEAWLKDIASVIQLERANPVKRERGTLNTGNS